MLTVSTKLLAMRAMLASKLLLAGGGAPAMNTEPLLRLSIAYNVARYTSIVWLTYVSQVPIWPAASMAS